MILTPSPKQQFFGNNGRPLEGGLVFTYAAGTNNKVATYSDEAGTPNTNPIVLDFRGEANIWLDPEQAYKFVLAPRGDTDPPTNPIWSVDNIEAPFGDSNLTQQFIGQRLWPRTAAEIAAGITPSDYGYEWFDPRRYATVAQWSAVAAAVGSLTDSYPGWYRGDRAQHPALTNCIVGYKAYDDAQKSGTIGYRCTAIGALALAGNTDSAAAGGTNTAVGYAAMESCNECSGNTGVGVFALNSITGVNSSHNNAFGYRVWPSLVDGTQNNGFGFQAGDLLVTGNNNHAFGENTLSHLVNGNGNHSFGFQASYTKTGGDNTHAFGFQALFNETAAVITGISKAASAVVTISTVSSINPFSVGQPVNVQGVAGMTEINGLNALVTSIGGSSGAWTVTLSIDSSGFTTYTSGGTLSPHGNTAFGYRVGFNVSMRGGNTIIGADAAQAAEPGYGNTLCGYQAGNAINANAGGDGGELNTLVGFWAGRVITSGALNACFGQRSGDSLTTGSENTIIGPNAGISVTTSDRCTFVGSESGENLNGDLNTGCGYNAGATATAQNYTNTSSFGANAIPTGSNQVTLGDNSVVALRCQQTSITALSDARFKKNIRSLEMPAGAMSDLQVVIFEWIDLGMPQGPQVGFIAQSLDAWQEKWDLQWLNLVDKSNPDRWEATPGKLLFPLILEFQKLSARVAALEGDDQWRGALT
jgi:hypothetical protein